MDHRLAGAVIGAGVLACAPLAWAAGSTLNDDPFPGADYAITPPDVSGAATALIGALALLVVAAGCLVLRSGVRRGDLPAHTPQVVLPLALLAAYVGCFYAVATAPTIGANIGGGIMYLGLFVAVPAALAFAARPYWSRRRHHPA